MNTQTLLRENEKLRALALAVEAENERLQEEIASTRKMVASVGDQLAGIERESRGIAEQYTTAMRQNASLANLYVASFMLHSSLDREEVLSGIAQIIVNIVGSEDYAILERNDGEMRVIAASGENGTRVRGFDPETDVAGLTAFIPLAIGDHVTGAIAIFRLLPQKPMLTEGDGELFEMLSAHAAMALYCASLHERFGREVPQCERASR